MKVYTCFCAPFSATLHYHNRTLASTRKQTKKIPKMYPFCPGGHNINIKARGMYLSFDFGW